MAHAPPAAQLSNNQAASVLLASGLPSQSLDVFIGAGLEPRRLLELLQEGWRPDQILNLVSRFAQPEEHADGGRAEHDRYADFPESENIEDRREWDNNIGQMPKRTRHFWDPDYIDRPARGLEKQLGRDAIPSRRRSAQ